MAPNRSLPDRISPDRTPQLRELMQQVGLKSLREFRDRVRFTRKNLDLIRQGQVEQMKFQDLQLLAEVLQISVSQVLQVFGKSGGRDRGELPTSGTMGADNSIENLKVEYRRLAAQLEDQQTQLRAEFQREILQKLESLLLQLPTAAFAAQQNPQMPARNLLPLLRPIDDLLAGWQIERIGEVGAQLSYDPRVHQVMDGGEIAAGTKVVVRYVGYRQGDTLLYRARVSLP